MHSHSRPRWCRSPRLLVILAIGFILTGLIYTTPPGKSILYRSKRPSVAGLTFSAHRLKAFAPPPTHDASGKRRLRLFMPADSPHINLCKAIMSAVALGYPMPTLLNWDGDFNRPEWHLAGSHIAKLESLLAVIETILDSADDDGSDDDLALLIDAYDIWFQLPPSVLISRFHQLNQEADARNQRQWHDAETFAGAGTFPVPPPKQSIVVTTAKHCSPDSESGSTPHYEYWPPSPMPLDLFGPGTDAELNLPLDPARRYKNIRPRCVNSGMIMGTMGALRAALTRCKEKAEAVARSGRQIWSDQALFGEVIGEQEIWRKWMREMAMTWNGTDVVNSAAQFTPEARDVIFKAMAGSRLEFGIGLDYNFTTIPATCSAEEEGYFVKLNDKEAVAAESAKAGMPRGEVRVHGVPPELAIHKFADEDPLKNIQWSDVPLYTDFFFGTTPVGIHHNAYIENLKPKRLASWWSLTWFYPRLRELVTANLRPDHASEKASSPLGKVSHKDGNIEYWAPDEGAESRRVNVFDPRRGSVKPSFRKIEWDSVCQKGPKPWYDELFGDSKGPLVE